MKILSLCAIKIKSNKKIILCMKKNSAYKSQQLLFIGPRSTAVDAGSATAVCTQ